MSVLAVFPCASAAVDASTRWAATGARAQTDLGEIAALPVFFTLF